MQKRRYSEICVNGNVWGREDSLTPSRLSYRVHFDSINREEKCLVGGALEPQLYAAPLSHAQRMANRGRLGETWNYGQVGH